MKLLDQLGVRVRQAVRRRAPTGRPASLAFRLDNFDDPIEHLPKLQPADWAGALVDLVRRYGALPVRVIGHGDNPGVAELGRIAWRLECPTTLRIGSRGLASHAAACVDSGARAVEVVAGEDLEAALAALARVRADRGAKLTIRLEVPPPLSVREIGERGLAAGADVVRFGLPWDGGPFDVHEAQAWSAPGHQTPPDVLALAARYGGDGPGAPRVEGHCPVGRRRWELAPDGTLSACPFQPHAWTLGEAAPDLRAHLAAIRACPRACGHADLRAD